MSARVRVDQSMCARTGFCVRVAPHVFVLPEDGPATVVQAAAAADLDAVHEAELVCPTQAITIAP